MTQARLAELAGISKQSVSDIELGRWGTRLDKARRIAAALGLTLEQIQPQDQGADKDAAA